MSDTENQAGTADTATSNETVTAAPAIDYKALATEMLAQQKAATEAAEAEAAAKAAEEAAKPASFSTEEVQALIAAATESATAEATQKALEEARRSGSINRTGHTTEAATPYYEAIRESDEAQATFLGKLDNNQLAKIIGAVAADDRNIMAFAPRLAASSR